MMSESKSKSELKKIKMLAREYLREGYEVLIEPGPESLPRFLSNYRPDLLLNRGDEHIVVEVKSHSNLRQFKDFESLAETIKKNSGWKLELVLISSSADDREQDLIPDSKVSERRLEESHSLLNRNLYEAALLVGWAATEGILRQIAAREGKRFSKNISIRIVKELYSLGAINRKELDALRKFWKTRSEIVHGFEAPKLTPDEIKSFLLLAGRLQSRLK